MKSNKTLRCAVLASAVAMALVMSAGAAAQATGAQTTPEVATASREVVVNIPSQALRTALDQFARETGIQVVYAHDVLPEGARSPDVTGKLAVDAILRRLLTPSGLTWKYVNARTVSIQKPASKPVATATQLDVTPPPASDSAAQVAAAGNEDARTLETMQVVGTNLTNIPPATPVIMFDADRIAAGGYSSLQDVLRHLPQNFASQSEVSTALGEEEFDSTTHPMSSVGADSVNLRGLGSRATLILINGRRIAGSAQFNGGYTDISSIPLSQVERIEVMTAGASAIYGADAVGGVVNIVLKKDYDGTALEMGHESSGTGADISRLSLAHTFGWGSGYLTAAAAYRRSMSADVNGLIHVGPNGRGDFTDLGGYDARVHNFGQPGVVYTADKVYTGNYKPGYVLGVVPGGQDGTALQPGDLLPYDAETAPSTYQPIRVGPDIKRPSIRFYGEQELGADLRLTFDASYAKQTNFQSWHPSIGDFGISQRGLTTYIPETNKYNTFGEDLLVGYSFAKEFSGMTFTQSQQQSNVNLRAGLNGKLPFTKTWTFDLSAGTSHEWSRTDRLQDIYNLRYPGDDEHEALIYEFMNNVNVFGDGSNDAIVQANRDLLSALVKRYVTTFDSDMRNASGFLRGDLFSLPGGVAQLVVGGEYKQQDYVSRTDWSGYTVGTYTIEDQALFAELGLPLLRDLPWAKELNLSFAARYGRFKQHGTNMLKDSTYTGGENLAQLGGFDLVYLTGAVPGTKNSEYGPATLVQRDYSNTSEQVRLAWSPVESLRFRATWGESFLTPSPTQMFGRNTIGNSTSWLSNQGGELPEGYDILLRLSGPNPNLKPQVATTKTFGVDFMPAISDGLTISVTYTDTDFENYIGSPLSNSSFLTGIGDIEELPRGVFIRGDNGVLLWDARLINYAGRHSRTVDTTIDWYFGNMASGDWHLAFNAARTLELTATTLPGTPEVVYSDSEKGPGKWAINTMLSWQKGGFTASTELHYDAPFRVLYPASETKIDNPNPRRTAGSYTTMNAQVGYKWERGIGGWLDGLTVRFGVKDLFRREAPFVDNSWGFTSTRANTRGRILYFDLSKTF